MAARLWRAVLAGDLPVVAVALHDGQAVRAEVARRSGLSPPVRRREEDPWTGRLAAAVPSHVVVQRSRFEVDLNRPPGREVYAGPADAWGLPVWRRPPGPDLLARSRALHVSFYAALRRLLERLVARHGAVVVLDLHAYNVRRDGPAAAAAPVAGSPEVNVGTEVLDRARWGGLVDRFCQDLAVAGDLDVRENVRFRGGHLVRWVAATFPGTGCALAVEFRKTFCDEWSGAVDQAALARRQAALAATLPGLQAAAGLLAAR